MWAIKISNRGWRAALQKLAAEVLPDKPMSFAPKNLLNRLTGLAPVVESEPEPELETGDA